MAVSGTTGNDIITPTVDGQTYLGGAGNDIYILSNQVAAGGTVVIQDTEGDNKIQLIDGLEITSSLVTSNAVELTLSNGAKVQILGANNLTFELGGNPLTGEPGDLQAFAAFVEETLGTTVPAPGEAPSTGGEVVIGEEPEPTYTLAADAESVDEGATATFTLTTENVDEGTEVAYTISGVDAADVDGALTGVAVVGADGTATIEVALLADATTEGEETLTVTIDGTDATADVTVNDTSLDPEDTFTLAEAVALGEDLPEEYTIQDVPGNLFDGEGIAEGAEAILDGAAAIDVTEDMTVAQYDLVDGLATFDVANLAYSIADTWDNLWQRIGDPVLEKVGLDYEITEAADYDFGVISEEEEAFIQGASNFSEDWNYNLDPITMTFDSLADARAYVEGQWEAGEQPEWGAYRINDTMDNLLANADVNDVMVINGAGEVNATGDSTIAQIQQFQDFYGWEDGEGNVYSMLNDYFLSDTAENLLNEDNAAIVDGAQEIGLSEGVTVAEYNDLVAQFDQAFSYEIADTLENLLAADEAVLAGADSYSLTDDVAAFEDLAVADALSADEQAMLDGAANRADYTYSLADGLAELATAEEGVVDAADEYTLTDAAGAFEDLAVVDILDEVEAGILNGAENAADYTYTLADTADAFFANGELNEGLAELLPLASAVEVTTEVTTAQYDAMIAVYPDAVFAGGLPGEIIVMNDPGAYEGTDGNDTFIATSDSLDNSVVDGKLGVDQLNLNLNENYEVSPGSVMSVEDVWIRSTDGAAQLDMSNFQGVEQVWADRISENLVVNNLSEVVTVGVFRGDDTKNVDINFDAATLEDINDGDGLDVILERANINDLDVGAVEVINLMSTGSSANAITDELITGGTLETLNIMGTQDVTIATALEASVTTVDAEGLEGDLDLTLTNVDVSTAADSFNLMGGSGDDTFTFNGKLAAVHADADLSINGSGGTNALIVTGAAAFDTTDIAEGDITNIQVVHATPGNGNAIDVTMVGGLEELQLSGNGSNAVTIADGVDVRSLANAATALPLTVDGADTNNRVAEQNIFVGIAEADADGNAATAASIDIGTITVTWTEHLSIAAESDGNNRSHTVGAITNTNNVLDTLSLDADSADLEIGTITSYAGAAADDDTFTLNLMGTNDTATGAITLGAQINNFAINNEGEGDRDVTFTGGLDASFRGAAAEGSVAIEGEGDGALFLRSTVAVLDDLQLSNNSASDLIVVQTNTGTTDVQYMEGLTAYGFDVTNAAAQVDSLAAGVQVELMTDNNNTVTVAQDGAATNDDATLDVVIGDRTAAAAADVTQNVLTAANIQNINITGLNGAAGHTITTLTAAAAKTISVNTDDDDSDVTIGTFALRNDTTDRTTSLSTSGEGAVEFTTLTDHTSQRTLNVEANAEEGTTIGTYNVNSGATFTHTINLTGSEDVTITTLGAAAATNIAVINAAGDGDRDVVITNAVITNLNGLQTTGDEDIEIGRVGSNAIGGKALQLQGDGDVEIGVVDNAVGGGKGVIAADSIFTIRSQSTDGSGENVLVDASDITVTGHATTGAVLRIIGNQDFQLGSEGTNGDEALVSGTAGAGLKTFLDASTFTGKLTAHLMAFDTAVDDGAEFMTVQLGTGDADIYLYGTGAAGARDSGNAVNGNDGTFTFEFSADGVGHVEISDFQLAIDTGGGTQVAQDILDFSNITDIIGVVDLNISDDGTDTTITSDSFDGEIVLLGITGADLSSAGTDNLAFA